MRYYRFEVKEIDGSNHYVKVRAINEAQAMMVASQEFPARISIERVKRIPRSMDQYAIDLG